MTLKIGFGQATFYRDFELTKEIVERIHEYVDFVLISHDGSLTDDQINYFKSVPNVILVPYEWTDDFAVLRNTHIRKALEMGIDWIWISDPDEKYNDDLIKDIRILTEKYDSEGFNTFSILCKDQFGQEDNIYKLDLLEEYPEEYQDTSFYKPFLAYKLFKGMEYQCTGHERRVHETLLTKHPLKNINLLDKYFYIHSKSSLTIWRNAARNMFLSGGGNCVGNKNRLWIELRYWCSSVGINSWPEFEQFVNNPGIVNKKEKRDEFNLWLGAALKSPATKEGTETRELAKWYLALNSGEITDKMKEIINNTPEVENETEIEEFVYRIYYDVLKRPPDRQGLDNYVQKILKNEMKRSDLAEALKTGSTEYSEKFGNMPSHSMSNISITDDSYRSKLSPEEQIRYDKIRKFVDSMYCKILSRPSGGDSVGINHYTKAIMEKIIKPVDLPDIFRSSEEYFDLKRGILQNSRVRPMMSIQTPQMTSVTGTIKTAKAELKSVHMGDKTSHNTVAFCVMCKQEELPFVIESINTVSKYVDEIHVTSDNLTEKDIQTLKSIDNRVQVHHVEWKDNFSEYKNASESFVTTEWCLSCDADEIPTKELAENLKNIIKSSDRGNNYDCLQLNVISETLENGKVISSAKTIGKSAILHWSIPNIFYGDVHVWIRDGYYPFKTIESEYAYRHIKEGDSVLQRSARNVWMGGGSDTVKEKNPLWKPLRDISNELGLDSWKKFDEYLKKGNIDKRIKKIFNDMCEIQWKDLELHDLIRYYNFLHPETK